MNLKLLTDKKNWAKLFFVYRENKLNSLMEKSYGEKDASAKVYGFYHAYCMCDGWENLVKEQLTHVVSSGLYERIDKLYIGALIRDNDLNTLKLLISNYSKIEIMYTNEDRTLFEYPTLMALQKKCTEEDFIGFYFHTKGISWINNPTVYKVGNSWRLMSEYFMFDRWKLAVHAIASGKDVYGTNYQEINNGKKRIIGGNFWWFRSDYVKSLYELKVNKQNRNESELWILHDSNNVYCPFYFSGNTRNDYLPKELYLPSQKWIRIKLAVKIYFTRFRYLFKRLFGMKVDLVNPNGVVNENK